MTRGPDIIQVRFPRKAMTRCGRHDQYPLMIRTLLLCFSEAEAREEITQIISTLCPICGSWTTRRLIVIEYALNDDCRYLPESSSSFGVRNLDWELRSPAE